MEANGKLEIGTAYDPTGYWPAGCVPGWLMLRRGLPDGAKRCWSLLTYHSGGTAPKLEDLARELRVSTRQVKYYLHDLRVAGLIEMERHGRGGNSYSFLITWDALSEMGKSDFPINQERGSSTSPFPDETGSGTSPFPALPPPPTPPTPTREDLTAGRERVPRYEDPPAAAFLKQHAAFFLDAVGYCTEKQQTALVSLIEAQLAAGDLPTAALEYALSDAREKTRRGGTVSVPAFGIGLQRWREQGNAPPPEPEEPEDPKVTPKIRPGESLNDYQDRILAFSRRVETERVRRFEAEKAAAEAEWAAFQLKDGPAAPYAVS